MPAAPTDPLWPLAFFFITACHGQFSGTAGSRMREMSGQGLWESLLLIRGGSGRAGRLGGGQAGAARGQVGTFPRLRCLRTADGVCAGVAGNNSLFRSGRAIDVLEAVGEIEARSPPGITQEFNKQSETTETACNVMLGDLILKPLAGRKRSIRKLLLLVAASVAEASHAVCHSPPSAA